MTGTIFDAIRSSDAGRVNALLDAGSDINELDAFCKTPLHSAVESSQEAIARILVTRGANLHETDCGHNTALHLAVLAGAHALCKILLDAGCDTTMRNDEGLTPLHIAVAKQHLTICALLAQNKAALSAANREQETVLHLAASRRSTELCSLFLEHGAEVDAVDRSGYTSLHVAASRGGAEVCRLLVDRGADALKTVGSRKGLSNALFLALFDEPTCRVLVDAGLSPSARDEDNQISSLTPFQAAVSGNHVAAVRFFVFECGESIDQVTADGRSMMALADGLAEMVQTLHSIRTELMVAGSFPGAAVSSLTRKSGGMGML